MKTIFSPSFLIILILFTYDVKAEGYAQWDTATITTRDLNVPIKIEITKNNNKLDSLIVEVNNTTIRVPQSDLENVLPPQINTVSIGFWDPNQLDFHIAIRCGKLSSFPSEPLPTIVFFIFEGAKYSHKETFIANSPSKSLQRYRLLKKQE